MKDLKWANAEVVLVSIICSCVKNLNVNFKYNNTLLRTIVLCYCPNFLFFFLWLEYDVMGVGNCKAMLPDNSIPTTFHSVLHRLLFVLYFRLTPTSFILIQTMSVKGSFSHTVHLNLAFCFWHNVIAKDEYFKSVFFECLYR